MRRTLRYAALALVALLIAAAGAVVWLAFSPGAARWLASQLVLRFEGALAVDAVEGSLARGITLAGVTYRKEGLLVAIDRAQAAWDWSALLAFHARFRRLALDRVSVTLADDGEPAKLPESLAVPLRISVDEGHIAQLVVERGGQLSQIEDISFRGSADATRHVLDAIAIRIAAGRVNGRAQIDASPPFALSAELTYAPDTRDALPAARLALGGNLSDVQAEFDAEASWMNAAGSAAVSPFESVLLKRLTANVVKLALAERFPEAPHAALRATIDIGQVATDRFEGRIQVLNDDPGESAEQKVPLAAIDAGVRGNVDAVAFEPLELTLLGGQVLAGRGEYKGGALALDLNARALDLKALDRRLTKTRLAGTLRIHADAQTQSLIAELTQAGYRIETEALRQGEKLTVKRAHAAARGGTLTAAGELSLEAPHAFTASGSLRRFDPSAFIDSPSARIDAELTAQGRLTPQWSAQVGVRASGTGPRGEAFTADARALVQRERVTGLQARLAVGRNTLTAAGAYGAAGDVLLLDARLPALHELDQRLRGALDAKGRLSGDRERPDIQLEASGRALALPGDLGIGTLELRGALPSDWDRAIAFEAVAADVRLAATRAAKAVVTVRGTPRAHTIEASALGKELDARLRLAGGLSSIRSWSGELRSLDATQPTRVTLLAPARIALSPERIEVGAFTVTAVDARFAFGELLWTPEQFRTSGEFTQLAIAPFVAARTKRLRTSLVLSGNWSIAERAGLLSGNLNVSRDGGDVVMTGEAELPLALSALRLQARIDDNRIRASGRATSSTLGEFQAAAATEAARSGGAWVLSPGAPLSVEARGDFASIAWLGPLIDPGVVVSGRLSLRAKGDGTIGAPKVDGTIEGAALSVRLPAPGIALTDGELSARVVNDRIVVRSLRFRGGEGFVTVQGEGSLANGTSARLRLEADKLMLLNRRDAKLELDAKADIVFADGALRIKGSAHVAQGHLDLLRKAGVPTLASDIRVKGAEKPPQPAREPLRVIVDLTTDFGDRFVVTATDIGLGDRAALKPLSGDFRARVTGRVRTLSDANQVPQTSGRLTVVDGTYSMFGRRFRVERGNLNFGGPINNPGLDIFVARAANRLQFTPEVGISITGTAQAPRVRLVSVPEMPETEKLSWLLFGRGGQAFDTSVGSTAAAIAAPMTEFGWQLSEKLYVAYEQGATGTTNIVRIYSQLTDRVAIQAGAGDASSLFLLYTFTF